MVGDNGEPAEVFAVGASAGGVQALVRFVAALPGDLDACILVVLHIPPTGTSALAKILGRSGPLPATTARDGDAIAPGRILVAAPDHHLLVEVGHVRLDRGPRQNNHRPAIDATFRSLATAYGARCGGVVLSGSRADGAAGLLAIKRAGGWALVQDPGTAAYPSMPRRAMEATQADAVLEPGRLAEFVADLGRERSAGSLLPQASTL